MPPVGALPRAGKSVHYEDTPPPRPHFPLPKPFDTRMIGFGVPDVSVPLLSSSSSSGATEGAEAEGTKYIGPRRALWGEQKELARNPDALAQRTSRSECLLMALQADLREDDPAVARIACYDLSGGAGGDMEMDAAAVKQACMVWKSPARRRAMRTLLLTRAALSDAGLRVLARWVAQAPSAPAPLRLERLQLDENDLWAPAFGELLRSFAGNVAATVEQLEANNCHVGAWAPAGTVPPTLAASPKAKDGNSIPGAAPGQAQPDDSGAMTPRNQAAAAAAASAALSAATASATQCFSPWVSLLSAAHCRLIQLSLCQCSLTDVAAAYLAEGLRSNSSLRELRLDDNVLTDSAARVIAVALGGRYAEEQAEQAAAAAAAAEAAAALAGALSGDEGSNRPTARPTSRGGSRSSLSTSASAGGAGSNKKKGGPGSPPEPLQSAMASGGSHNHTKRLSFSLGPSSPTNKAGGHYQHHHSNNGNNGEQQQQGSDGSHSVDAATATLSALSLPGGVALSVPLPSFPASGRTNSSLRLLSLARNRVTAAGIAHLEAAARANPALRHVRAEGQTGVRSFEQAAHAQALQQLKSSCAANRVRGLRATQHAFALGLHARAGGKSSLRTLRVGAEEMSAPVHQQPAALLAAALQDVWGFIGED